jgi:PAS domain S-box-containing protein
MAARKRPCSAGSDRDQRLGQVYDMLNVIAENKRVERTLHYLNIIAEHTSEAIAILDLDGVIQYANRAWAELHGCDTTDELIDEHLTAFHLDHRLHPELQQMLEEARRRTILSGPVEHYRKDQTSFFAQTKIAVVTDDNGRDIGFVVFARHNLDPNRYEEMKKQCEILSRKVDELTTELTEANQQLKEEIIERTQVENEMDQYRQKMLRCVDQISEELSLHNNQSPAISQNTADHILLRSIIEAPDQPQ